MNKNFFLILYLFQLVLFSAEAKFEFVNGNNKAIYGVDDRSFVDSRSSQKIKEISESVAMIVDKNIAKKFEHITKFFANSLVELKLCPEEKFAKHLSIGSCTGFLVGDDLLASAGHCFLNNSDCQNQLIVFKALSRNEAADGMIVSNENIYECKEIISQSHDPSIFLDFSIIRLKRKVHNIKVLKMRRSGELSLKDSVFMIGHPLGLPLIFTRNAKVLDINNPHFFNAELDSFSGNSGSPVFNSKTFKVEGILVRGEEDFIQDQSLQCYHNKVYNLEPSESVFLKNKSRGEGVTRINDILSFLER